MDNLLPKVLSILMTTPDRWSKLANMVPTDLLNTKPAPGEWSALECLQHLIDTEAIFQTRLEAFRAGRDFPGFNPDEEGTRLVHPTPEYLADEFARRRAESLRRLEGVTSADFALRALHAELGPVTLEQMINEWAAHDLNHTVQAEVALMQPFLKDCGPWQKYFTDHLISA